MHVLRRTPQIARGERVTEHRYRLSFTTGGLLVREASVAASLYQRKGDWSKVRTQSLAEKVTEIYKGRGSDRTDVSAESVGWAVKRLGVPSGRINKAGNGVELTNELCRLVHRLALSYGVRAMQSGPRRGCRYCEELDLAARQQTSHVAMNAAGSGT